MMGAAWAAQAMSANAAVMRRARVMVKSSRVGVAYVSDGGEKLVRFALLFWFLL